MGTRTYLVRIKDTIRAVPLRNPLFHSPRNCLNHGQIVGHIREISSFGTPLSVLIVPSSLLQIRSVVDIFNN